MLKASNLDEAIRLKRKYREANEVARRCYDIMIGIVPEDDSSDEEKIAQYRHALKVRDTIVEEANKIHFNVNN